jgi:MFS family permease
MMRDLGLTLLEMSAVFSAFTLSYSLFEIPSGWLGDVIGPRRVRGAGAGQQCYTGRRRVR